MKTKISRSNYVIRFHRVVELTSCFIYRGNKCIATGDARRSAEDNPNKSIGRKVSLTKAISKIPQKNVRTQLWKAYWNERARLGKGFHA